MSVTPPIAPRPLTPAERAAQREERQRALDQMYGYFGAEQT